MARQIFLDNEAIENIVKKLKKTYDLASKKVEFSFPEIKKTCTLYIPTKIQNKINALVENCQKEIAWHCLTTRVQEDVFMICDVIVFPQTVTAATVTSDADEYAKWIMTLDDKTFNNMKCHMHSHVNMGVSPSGTDTKYQNEVVQNEEDYFIFMIWNKKGDNWAKIVDIKNNILYEDKDISIDSDVSEDDEWAKNQINKYISYPINNFPKNTATNKLNWRDELRMLNDNGDAEDWSRYFQEELDLDFH